jgi:hypothetical protein
VFFRGLANFAQGMFVAGLTYDEELWSAAKFSFPVFIHELLSFNRIAFKVLQLARRAIAFNSEIIAPKAPLVCRFCV